MDWFLYDIGLRHERVKQFCFTIVMHKQNLFRLLIFEAKQTKWRFKPFFQFEQPET